jgi:hypothetical protein
VVVAAGFPCQLREELADDDASGAIEQATTNARDGEIVALLAGDAAAKIRRALSRQIHLTLQLEHARSKSAAARIHENARKADEAGDALRSS